MNGLSTVSGFSVLAVFHHLSASKLHAAGYHTAVLHC